MGQEDIDRKAVLPKICWRLNPLQYPIARLLRELALFIVHHVIATLQTRR